MIIKKSIKILTSLDILFLHAQRRVQDLKIILRNTGRGKNVFRGRIGPEGPKRVSALGAKQT